MATSGLLARELAVFEEHRLEWALQHPGKFVVMQGDEIVDGFFDDYGDAVRAGLKNFGAQRPFLVKQVWITDPVYFV
jgi:hypothetical protein